MRNALIELSGHLTRWIVPEIRYHQDVFVDVLETYVPDGGAWLDLGCGHQLLPRWHAAREPEMTRRPARMIGIDYDLDSLRKHRNIRARARGDISALPFRDATFDLVTANMVVEHLDDPAVQFREVARVLRPGGVFLFHTPNARNYQIQIANAVPEGLKTTLAGLVEGRKAEDVFPTYYRANTDEAVRALAAGCGLAVERLEHITTYPGLGVVPPLALVEILWIRALQHQSREELRHNLVVALRRPGTA